MTKAHRHKNLEILIQITNFTVFAGTLLADPLLSDKGALQMTGSIIARGSTQVVASS
jgi:hypothetical protein